MKLALLGTAALVAVSVSARADELADLKAQIEALQADVSALQAAPSVPAGYQLLTVSGAERIVAPGLEVRDSMGQAKTATTIGILPTADVPASTVIQWSGSVRAAIAYSDVEHSPYIGLDYDSLHLKARGRLDVTGTTDTAVGEVGASISMYADFDNNLAAGGTGFTSNSAGVMMDYAWGWWKMTPELTFAGGYNGSLATIGMGLRKVNDAYISRGVSTVDGGDFTQMRVSYASGPIGLAVAIEHTDEGDNQTTPALTGSDSAFGFAAEATYAGDMFNAEIAGYIRDADADPAWYTGPLAGDHTQSQVGIGLGANLSDMFNVSVAGSIGNNVFYRSPTTAFPYATLADGWEVSAAVIATLSDSISAELGAGFSSYEEQGSAEEADEMTIAGGVYWSPVSQLKMGVQASWNSYDFSGVGGIPNADVDVTKAAFVTWWNF
jgi:hypothetical protein